MFELPIFLFQVLESLRFAAFHASVLGFPAIVGVLGDAMLPAQLRRAQPGFTLFQDGDDLLFAVSFAFHSGSPSPGETLIVGWHSFWGLGQDQDSSTLPRAERLGQRIAGGPGH